MPVPGTPLATGLSADVAQLRWATDLVSRLQIRSTHLEDQLRASRDELSELADREADAPQVVDLHGRIRGGELGLALAEQRPERLRAGMSRSEWSVASIRFPQVVRALAAI